MGSEQAVKDTMAWHRPQHNKEVKKNTHTHRQTNKLKDIYVNAEMIRAQRFQKSNILVFGVWLNQRSLTHTPTQIEDIELWNDIRCFQPNELGQFIIGDLKMNEDNILSKANNSFQSKQGGRWRCQETMLT